jgi:hypothetical protein
MERGDGVRAAPPDPGGSCHGWVAPRDSGEAMGWRRGRIGRGGCTPVGVRVRFEDRSRADPIWPSPSGVPRRCTGQEPTLDPARLSRHKATTNCDRTDRPSLPSARHSLVPPRPRLQARRYRPPLSKSQRPVHVPLTSLPRRAPPDCWSRGLVTCWLVLRNRPHSGLFREGFGMARTLWPWPRMI